MVEQTPDASTIEETPLDEAENPLTGRAVLSAVAGGIAGLVAMAPVIAGVPMLLGVFRTGPLAEFGNLVISQPSTTLGVAFFAAGGAVVLPLFFVVTASFLPPREPRYLRGVTISTMFWVAFAYIFWPADGLVVDVIFVATTLAAHWIYGAVLGYVMQSLTGIPEHEV